MSERFVQCGTPNFVFDKFQRKEVEIAPLLNAICQRLDDPLESCERERVYPDICTVCGGIIPIGCHEVHMRQHKMAQLKPVTERFVRYKLSEVYEKLTDGTMISLKPQVFTRKMVGVTVAVYDEEMNTWRITFWDGTVDAFHDRRYQTLKANGAFGEEQ